MRAVVGHAAVGFDDSVRALDAIEAGIARPRAGETGEFRARQLDGVALANMLRNKQYSEQWWSGWFLVYCDPAIAGKGITAASPRAQLPQECRHRGMP